VPVPTTSPKKVDNNRHKEEENGGRHVGGKQRNTLEDPPAFTFGGTNDRPLQGTTIPGVNASQEESAEVSAHHPIVREKKYRALRPEERTLSLRARREKRGDRGQRWKGRGFKKSNKAWARRHTGTGRGGIRNLSEGRKKSCCPRRSTSESQTPQMRLGLRQKTARNKREWGPRLGK